MNFVWIVLVCASIVFLLFTSPGAVLAAFTSASNSAIELCLKMAGIYAVWLGVMSLAGKCGLNDALSRLLRPVTRFLFGKSSNEAKSYAALNMSANILGLGNAATPMGIKAANAMRDNVYALAMLMVVNSASLQLVPTTVISLRAQLGSAAPASVLLPSLAASLVSFAVGILLVAVFFKKDDKSHDLGE